MTEWDLSRTYPVSCTSFLMERNLAANLPFCSIVVCGRRLVKAIRCARVRRRTTCYSMSTRVNIDQPDPVPGGLQETLDIRHQAGRRNLAGHVAYCRPGCSRFPAFARRSTMRYCITHASSGNWRRRYIQSVIDGPSIVKGLKILECTRGKWPLFSPTYSIATA